MIVSGSVKHFDVPGDHSCRGSSWIIHFRPRPTYQASLRIMVIATEVWPDGSSYEGSWFQGALHGQGRFDSRFDGGRYMQGGPAMGVGSVPPVFFHSSLKTEHETVQTSTTYV